MDMNIDGPEAVALAELLPGVTLKFIPPEGGEHASISPEQGKELIRSGQGNRVFIPMPEARVRAIIHALVRAETAAKGITQTIAAVEEQLLSDRAKLVTETAGRIMASLTATITDETRLKDRPLLHTAHATMALDAAEALDTELWKRTEAKMPKEGV